MEGFKTFSKAIAIMFLGAGGTAALVDGFKVYDSGGSIFWGVLALLGAAFLYRAWFWAR
jgi:hypothetical protein